MKGATAREGLHAAGTGARAAAHPEMRVPAFFARHTSVHGLVGLSPANTSPLPSSTTLKTGPTSPRAISIEYSRPNWACGWVGGWVG